ncbi:MAG: hypothetical protein ACTHOL_08945 [Luteibacter jiangsuensis]
MTLGKRPRIIAIVLGFAGAASSCPVEKAHYVYTDKKSQGTADFIAVSHPMEGMGDRVALHIHFPKIKGYKALDFNDWFLFNQGNGPMIDLIESFRPDAPDWKSSEDPHRRGVLSNLEYFAWNEDHKIIYEAPSPGSKAPKYIFLPDLATSLLQAKHQSIGWGMFKLEKCDP